MFAAGKAVSGAAPTDAQFNYVTMLLHGDGTNGAQNNTFVDSSTNNFTITRNGNTTQGTFSPYGSNWSNYFGGSDYITLSSAPISATGAFTFECWVFVTGTASSQAIYGQYLGANSGRFNMFWNDVANKFSLSIATTSYDSASTYSANTWYHIAWVRDGSNNLSLYVNGVRDFTTTGVSTSLYTGNPIIAARASGATPYTGYISNMRITNTAVYSGTSFTVPTTPLTNISGTTLLTCQSNRFVDNETTPLTFTISGSPSVQRFSPFSPTSAYTTSVISGSGYFDGSGDYLVTPSNTALSLGTGAFSVEFWVYITSLAQDPSLINSNSTSIFYEVTGANRGLCFYASGAAQLTSATTVLPLNSWNHVVVCRNSGGTLSSFVNGSRISTTSSNTSSADFSASYIGRYIASAAGHLFGYMSDIRMVKASTPYDPTASTLTVPTSPLTAITNTSLLLNYTNAGILDNAMMNDLETVGNAQISTSVKKYGTGSMYFDGTTDYIVELTNLNFGYGTGDFTIEFWLYLNALTDQTIISNLSSASSVNPHIYYSSAGGIRYYTNGADRITGSSLSTSTWYHIAICRSSGSTRLFINGTQSGSTYADSNNYGTSAPLGIATYWLSGSPVTASTLNGYLDDIRITRGVGRYTANFTAPTAAFPDKG